MAEASWQARPLASGGGEATPSWQPLEQWLSPAPDEAPNAGGAPPQGRAAPPCARVEEGLPLLPPERPPAGRRRPAAALAAAFVALVGASALVALRRHAGGSPGRWAGEHGLLQAAQTRSCKHIDEGTDYETDEGLDLITGVESAEDCRKACVDIEECGAWTWGRAKDTAGVTDVCWPKVLDSAEKVLKRVNVAVSSGYPCRSGGSGDHVAFENDSGASEDDGSDSDSEDDGGDSDSDSGDSDEGGMAADSGGENNSSAKPSLAAGVTTTKTGTTTTTTTLLKLSGPLTTTSTKSLYTTRKPSSNSMYCFALMIPNTYEEELLRWQVEQHVSLFSCDEAGVFSNVTKEVAPGVRTIKIESTLTCEKGGEFGTALNTDIFFAVWDGVVAKGRYALHDWTVKVDPDCVFFPERMVPTLSPHVTAGREGTGVYINNCPFGMHGPLEVFSRAAVDTWHDGHQSCFDHFSELCDGPCLWGEDMFIDQCLQKWLNSTRVDDFGQLVEDHCDPPPSWQECKNGTVAALHPFKNISSYKKCHEAAKATSGGAALVAAPSAPEGDEVAGEEPSADGAVPDDSEAADSGEAGAADGEEAGSTAAPEEAGGGPQDAEASSDAAAVNVLGRL